MKVLLIWYDLVIFSFILIVLFNNLIVYITLLFYNSFTLYLIFFYVYSSKCVILKQSIIYSNDIFIKATQYSKIIRYIIKIYQPSKHIGFKKGLLVYIILYYFVNLNIIFKLILI